MPQVLFSTPTPADVDELVASMRDQDVAEVLAAGYADTRTPVAEGVQRSVMCWTCRVDGKLAAIFGLAPFGGMLSDTGVPWLLGTDEVPRHRRILARVARPYIARMLAQTPRLMNVVHADNTVAVRWLARMGFKLSPAAPAGPHGALFHSFEMTRDV